MEVGLIKTEKKTKYLKSTKKETRNESLNINNLQIGRLHTCHLYPGKEPLLNFGQNTHGLRYFLDVVAKTKLSTPLP
jgi:hypothetical protein